MNRPKLRPIEAVPTEHGGQQIIMLRDPLRLSEAVLLVPIGLLPILQRLDGLHAFEDICEECMAIHGLKVQEEGLRQIVLQLEQVHFLEGEDFEAWRSSLEREFLALPTRPSFLAGRSYDADPVALRNRIDEFFTHEEGPGLPLKNGGSPNGRLRGVVAPHIDFHRGGPTFAWGYRAVAERADADVFFCLGTVHAPTRGIYNLTRKSFETPLGVMQVDRELTDSLARRAPGDSFQDEFVQRAEHSLEFQAVFLQYLYGGRRPVTFVPVLVGSFGEFVAAGDSPQGDEEVEGFIAALGETIKEAEEGGKKTCLLTSVDLAHVGPLYGDAEPVDEIRLAALEEADKKSLDAVCRGDAEAFYWSVAEDGDARKVCGLAPIYTMLRTLDGCQGEVLRYSQWPDPNGTVTFCSVALH